MELRSLCAYNQTRECFLGLEVASADLSMADLRNLLNKLALKSGEGLWMLPFRGIPDINLRIPLDLIYMDEDCQVIEVVETFPTSRASSSSSQAASVLALPTHSIYSSQTQTGDQLVLCMAEEMQTRLEDFSAPTVVSGGVQTATILKVKPLWSAVADEIDLEESLVEEMPESELPEDASPVEPERRGIKPPKGWLERWWSPDPKKAPDRRSAEREPSYGLAAFYWTGASPQGHTIRDISSTGLYVVTEERWYPGTLILMTLQETIGGVVNADRSISVHSRSVRWGNDGVGLQFIPQDAFEAKNQLKPLVAGATQAEINQFLEQVRRTKA